MREKKGFGPWGWLLLIFGLLVLFSNDDFSADGTNIISPAVAEQLSVDQSIILTMSSVADIVGVLVAVAAGQINQRIGPSKVAAGCLILAGLGHIAACNAVNVPMYLIAMCFMGGGLGPGSFVGMGAPVAMWFPKRQRRAMSIVAIGSNFGTILFIPLLNVLTGSIGMPMDSAICGDVTAVVGVVGVALLHDTPKERGLYPDNVTEAEFKANYSSTPLELDNSGWVTGELLRTKETWLCALSIGFLMLAQMGIMTQLVARNIEVDVAPDLTVSVMSAIAVIGIIGAVISGRILLRLGIKRAGVLTDVLHIVAMLFNISGVMPLVWVSLVVIGSLGTAAPALMSSVPGSVFGRVDYAKVNSAMFPLTNIIFMCNFAINSPTKKLFNNLSAAYIAFIGLAFPSILLILALQDHKYDQDYMAAYKQ